MISLLSLGAGLITYWWVIPLLIVLSLVGGFLTIGTRILDIAILVLKFLFNTRLGNALIGLAALYFAACAGFDVMRSQCAAQKTSAELADSETLRKTDRAQVAAGDEIQLQDSEQAAIDAADSKKLEDLINGIPKDRKRTRVQCLDRPALERLQNLR
jgi:hypothetical protein